MNNRALAVVGGLVSTLLFIGQTAAHAEAIRCYTSPSYLGHAVLDMTQDLFYVEDGDADARRVVASAYNSAGTRLAYAYDANGADNGPGAGVYVDASRVYRVTTCTQRGTDITTRANCWNTYF
ncbi:hypothetical protein [Streptomyces lavendulocolor]|uniref:hypothetical protein n=1 Tax=Streptomyces lavendulocolor TaxID=67316 RepID=UPI003C2B63A3